MCNYSAITCTVPHIHQNNDNITGPTHSTSIGILPEKEDILMISTSILSEAFLKCPPPICLLNLISITYYFHKVHLISYFNWNTESIDH